jgi:hypothetical protein
LPSTFGPSVITVKRRRFLIRQSLRRSGLDQCLMQEIAIAEWFIADGTGNHFVILGMKNDVPCS